MSSAHRIASDEYLASAETPDPGASGNIIPTKSHSICPMVSAAAETRTVPRPLRTGVVLYLQMRTDGGNITVTVTGGYNEAGSTTLTFSDPGQMVGLISVDIGGTLAWRTLGSFPTTAALTTALTTITMADAAGTPDYAMQAVINTNAYGFASAAEAISALYVIANLQTRVNEVEVILKAAGLAR